MDDEKLRALTEDFNALAERLHAESGSVEALTTALKTVTKHVQGCDHASISDADVRTIVASDDTARLADALQHKFGEGPCLQAARDRDEYYSFDVTTETRWSDYVAALRDETPIRSSLALPLRSEKAALNLFADRPAAFDDEALTTAAVIATLVSALLAIHRSEDEAFHLRQALNNSRLIGTAVGIVMNARRITRDDAFGLLSRASQNLNRKIADIADRVVETGAMPPEPPRSG